MKKHNRIGEINTTKEGYKIEIVEYNNNKDIVVAFDNGYKTKTTYRQFESGNVKNPYHKSVYHFGYIGVGDYKTSINGRQTIQYKYWNSMLQRCYSKETLIKKITYLDKIVCEEWLNFQNFAKWFDFNYYEVQGETMQLDKDILIKNNNVYSPETCIFVPNRINSLFTKADARRGKYNIGVYFNKSKNKFRANMSMLDENGKQRQKHLGYFTNEAEAFKVYKQAKEQYIKEVAEQYKDKIPSKLYRAMNEYEVSIND